MYYYFYNNRKVVESETPIDTNINKEFVELTSEESEFYVKNPNATISEVKNKSLYKAPEINTKEYAEGKLVELEDLCNSSITIPIQDYLLAIACVDEKSSIYTGAKYYSSKDALAIIKQFMDESTNAHLTYDKYSKQMLSTKSGEGVDSAIDNAKKELKL